MSFCDSLLFLLSKFPTKDIMPEVNTNDGLKKYKESFAKI